MRYIRDKFKNIVPFNIFRVFVQALNSDNTISINRNLFFFLVYFVIFLCPLWLIFFATLPR